jgi:hypothetical protein
MTSQGPSALRERWEHRRRPTAHPQSLSETLPKDGRPPKAHSTGEAIEGSAHGTLKPETLRDSYLRLSPRTRLYLSLGKFRLGAKRFLVFAIYMHLNGHFFDKLIAGEQNTSIAARPDTGMHEVANAALPPRQVFLVLHASELG